MNRFINTFFLVVCFLFVFGGNNQNIKFSRKYIPIYNPGGERFLSDQSFSKSYELYKKRQDAFEEKDVLNNGSRTISKNKSIINQHHFYDKREDLVLIDDNSMINSYGIDIARLRDAKFIQFPDDSSDYEEESSFTLFQQKETKSKLTKVNHAIISKVKNFIQKKAYSSSNNKKDIVKNQVNDIGDCYNSNYFGSILDSKEKV